MRLKFTPATEADVAELTALRLRASERLTLMYGWGHWSSRVTERGVRAGLRNGRALIARRGRKLVGTLTLCKKKQWSIDPSYFTPAVRPLYLINMAVEPGLQRVGIGRALLEEAARVARATPADAIRLDAYDDAAGAGGFYASCGYREVGRVSYRGVPLIYFESVLPMEPQATRTTRKPRRKRT